MQKQAQASTSSKQQTQLEQQRVKYSNTSILSFKLTSTVHLAQHKQVFR